MADTKLGCVDFAKIIRECTLEKIRARLRLDGKLGEFPIKTGGFESTEDGVYCGVYVDNTYIKVKVYNIPCIYDYRNEPSREYIQRTDFAACDSYFKDFNGNSTTVEEVLRYFPSTIRT